MRTLDRDSFDQLLRNAGIKSRVIAELKFAKSIEGLPSDWAEYELIAIADRTDDKGVLVLRPEDDLYIVPYVLSRKIVDSQTGRRRAIICDFCYTWQPGSNAASITFSLSNSKHTIGFLCCGDLRCSQHVRSLTSAAKVSRTQLRENMTDQDRVSRLKQRLRERIHQLELTGVA